MKNKLINYYIQIDKTLREESKESATPDWTKQEEYKMLKETEIIKEAVRWYSSH